MTPTYFYDWNTFKTFALTKQLGFQYTESASDYIITLTEGVLIWQIILVKDAGSDVIDFETNYKPNGNKANSISFQVSAAKTLPDGKKLYARNTGLQYAVTTGSNTLSYTATYPWVKLLGVECINCESLDTVDFKVYDTNTGTYSGVPNLLLNQFSYTLNLSAGYYSRTSLFDADMYAGMIIQMTYVSVSNKTIGLNLIMNEVKS